MVCHSAIEGDLRGSAHARLMYPEKYVAGLKARAVLLLGMPQACMGSSLSWQPLRSAHDYFSHQLNSVLAQPQL